MRGGNHHGIAQARRQIQEINGFLDFLAMADDAGLLAQTLRLPFQQQEELHAGGVHFGYLGKVQFQLFVGG